jgi:hypothetical protein
MTLGDDVIHLSRVSRDEDPKTLYVCNFSKRMTEQRLHEIFSPASIIHLHLFMFFHSYIFYSMERLSLFGCQLQEMKKLDSLLI